MNAGPEAGVPAGRMTQHGQDMLERLERYCTLRDGGTRPRDAAREVGVAERSGQRYERAYRARKGLPPRVAGEGASGYIAWNRERWS